MRISVTWNEMQRRLTEAGLEPQAVNLDQISALCPECNKEGKSDRITILRVKGYQGVEFGMETCWHNEDEVRADLGFSKSEVISKSRAGRGRRVRRE